VSGRERCGGGGANAPLGRCPSNILHRFALAVKAALNSAGSDGYSKRLCYGY
jgi:hypothetical protein